MTGHSALPKSTSIVGVIVLLENGEYIKIKPVSGKLTSGVRWMRQCRAPSIPMHRANIAIGFSPEDVRRDLISEHTDEIFD